MNINFNDSIVKDLIINDIEDYIKNDGDYE